MLTLKFKTISLISLCAVAIGCSGGSESGPDTPGTTVDAGVIAAPGSPVFLSLGTNVTSLTEGESITFTAVLTDPDGVSDVIGGSLISESGATYGAFSTSGQEGSYSLSVSWGDIHQVNEITFNGSDDRLFKAQFFDQAGNEAVKTINIELECDEQSACDGACTDLTTDLDHCGECNNECDVCDSSTCARMESSVAIVSCDTICQQAGATCAAGLCGDFSSTLETGACEIGEDYCYALSCSEYLDVDPEAEGMRCCCQF